MACHGMMSCVRSFLLLSGIPCLVKLERTAMIPIRLMYPAAPIQAFTLAMVVDTLSSATSLQCDDDLDEAPSGCEGKPEMHGELKKAGRSIGETQIIWSAQKTCWSTST